MTTLLHYSTSRWTLVAAALCACLATMGVLLPVASAQNTPERAHRLLSAWQMEEARQVIDALAGSQRNAPERHYLEGRYAFYMGDYAEALEHIDRALEQVERGDWRRLREIIAATKEVTKDYKRFESPSGRFEIFVEPGRDEVLIPWAIEALEAAYEVMGEELGYRPSAPVRVEIYPRTTVLADVSLLTEENIRTSGTIALCQYNRLMITSPRSVLRGYSWVDTLVHEYIHYVINQRTIENVPIWMHEGLAKYLERVWRGPDAARLEASSEHLLHRRMKANDLIPFEAMHPSMALLPSQEDAALAFAEVYTTMEYLRREVGPGAFSRLLDEINDGHDAMTAYARVLGTSWERFENHYWPTYLRERPRPRLADEDQVFDDRIVFQDQAAKEGNELDRVSVPQARDHIQIGQMLQARDRYAAAVVQYRKASEIIGQQNPVLQTRLAQSLIRSGAPEEAIAALAEVRELYPSYVLTWLELGRAYLSSGQFAEARDALHEAARINPFNPEVHELLARAYQNLGESEKAAKARQALELVRPRR